MNESTGTIPTNKTFTGGIGDWVLVYKKLFSDKSQTMKREKQIKKWKSRTMGEELIKRK